MMSGSRAEEILIDRMKREFESETGRSIKIMMCNKWESMTNFTEKGNFYAIVKLVFDFTGWTWKDTYLPSVYKTPDGRIKTAVRNREKVFRRSVIDYIAVNNGVEFSYLGRETGRINHTTVLHSVKQFDIDLEHDYYTQKTFKEILTYVKENYSDHKDRSTLKQEVIEGDSVT